MSDLKCIWCGSKLYYSDYLELEPTTPEGEDAVLTAEGYVCPCCEKPYYDEIELSQKQAEWRRYR